MGADAVGQLGEAAIEAKGEGAVDVVALELAGQAGDDAVVGRVGGDGQAREAAQAGGREDVDLDARAVVVREVGRRRGAVEEDDGQVAEEGIRGVVCDELLRRELNVVGDSNHGVVGGAGDRRQKRG